MAGPNSSNRGMRMSLTHLLLALSLWKCCCLADVPSAQQPLVSGSGTQERKSLDSYGPLDVEFDALVQKTMDQFHVPGLSLVIVQGEKTFAKGYGHAVLPSTAATNRTLYYIGSISKSFTAATLLHLTETTANTSAPIHLHTPISSLIPADFVLQEPYITQHATIADLLSHRTGMPRHDESYGGSRQTSLREHVRNLRNLPLTAPFRATYQYCNMMFSTLAHVIETVTGGTPFADVVEQAIFEPLGMSHAYASLDKALAAGEKGDIATGYYYHGQQRSKTEDDETDETCRQYTPQAPPTSPILTGAGSILLSPLSFAHYLRALLTSSLPLTPASHAFLRTPLDIDNEDSASPPTAANYTPYASAPLYGLAWAHQSVGRFTMLSHTGSVTGFGAAAAWLPELNWGVGVFANTDVSSNRVNQILLWRLLEERVALEEGGDGRKALGDAAWRYDWAEKYRRDDEAREEKRRNARAVVWPQAPDERDKAPLRRAVEEFAGTFADKGYGEIAIEVCPPPTAAAAAAASAPDAPLRSFPPSSPSSFSCPTFPSANASTPLRPLLFAHVRDRTWTHAWYFTHVNGDGFFLAWMDSLPGEPSRLSEGDVPRKAVFQTGVSGRVERLGMAYEPRMGLEEGLREVGDGADGLVWFERVD
ncbi:beta-lactamase/transpeptidase-like protein [Phyllosticta capitalensis]